MKHLTDGLLAAFIIAIVVAIWSMGVSIDWSVPGSGFLDTLLFIFATIGMVGLPISVFGLAIGVFVNTWRSELQGEENEVLDRQASAKIAAWTLLVPILAIIVGIIHLFVTAKFARATFQAIGIGLITLVVAFALFAVSPAIERFSSKVLAKTGFKPDKFYWATRKLLLILGILYTILIIAGSVYASTLNVWNLNFIVMFAVILLGVPALTWLMLAKRQKEWTVPSGVYVGIIVVLALLFGVSPYILSRSEATRSWIGKSPSVIGFEARIMRSVADGDGDGYAATWGGNDCNDSDATIYPGAHDIPGDGIDQSCSGSDAKLIIDYVGPARKVVMRAINRGESSAKQEAEKTPEPPKNILIILVDTLRMDHTGIGGHKKSTTPNIDKLASESTVFLNTYATSPHTPRSIPMIFISRYPSRTKWKGAQYNYPKVLPENLSVFEVLHDNGWRTQGESSHHYFQEKRGLWQGFDNWDNEGAKSIADSNSDIAAPRTWEKTIPVLEAFGRAAKNKNAKPFAMFLHFFEPHAQWISHPEFPFDNDGTTESKHAADYDSEIRFDDDYVGKVLEKLKETGLKDKTIVVIVADHGEAFNEHGYYFHGQTLYNEVIHVPLVIYVPGWKSQRIETPVSILDVAPTLLDLEKINIPNDFEGESLVPYMLNGDPKNPSQRPIFSELLPYTAFQEHHKAVILGHMKLINVLSKGTKELYDLAKDPGEKHNIIENKEAAKPLQDALDKFMAGQ